MTLKKWHANGWLRSHKTSADEIHNLFQIVERDLKDAHGGISADWQFGIAYNAALKLCTVLLYSEGYRPERTLQHYRTILSLPLILGEEKSDDASYLDRCRVKRNTAEYDLVGVATERDASELIAYVEELKADVIAFLRRKHPELIS